MCSYLWKERGVLVILTDDIIQGAALRAHKQPASIHKSRPQLKHAPKSCTTPVKHELCHEESQPREIGSLKAFCDSCCIDLGIRL